MDDRPTVDQYFVDMTHLVKSRGTCPRRQVGAVVVKDKRVLTTGYNGAPRGFPHPCDTGCIRDELKIPSGMMADVCPCLHAEQNAILQAATTGVSIEGSDIYCTTQPCTQCSRMIANCGIKRVIFEQEYADPMSIGLLVTAGVELWKWDVESRTAHRYGQSNTFEQAQDALRKKWAAGAFGPVETKQHVVEELQEALHIKAGAKPVTASKPAAPRPLPAAPPPPASSGPPPTPSEEPEEEHHAGAIRDLSNDPDRERKIREALATRKERLAKALEEGKL